MVQHTDYSTHARRVYWTLLLKPFYDFTLHTITTGLLTCHVYNYIS